MYRYKYTAAVNADKQAFYDASEEICKAYPYCKELPDNGVYNDTMRKYFSVTEQGEHKEVCVMLEKDCGRLTVSSDKYLRTYFKGKKVERILSGCSISVRTEAAISAVFAVVAVVSAGTAFHFECPVNIAGNAVICAVLAAAYTASGIALKLKYNLPELKLLFLQMGGLPLIGLAALGALFLFIIGGGLLAFVCAFEFCTSVLPALAASVIIRQVIIKKIYNTTTAKGEDMTKTE